MPSQSTWWCSMYVWHDMAWHCHIWHRTTYVSHDMTCVMHACTHMIWHACVTYDMTWHVWHIWYDVVTYDMTRHVWHIWYDIVILRDMCVTMKWHVARIWYDMHVWHNICVMLTHDMTYICDMTFVTMCVWQINMKWQVWYDLACVNMTWHDIIYDTCSMHDTCFTHRQVISAHL